MFSLSAVVWNYKLEVLTKKLGRYGLEKLQC